VIRVLLTDDTDAVLVSCRDYAQAMRVAGAALVGSAHGGPVVAHVVPGRATPATGDLIDALREGRPLSDLLVH